MDTSKLAPETRRIWENLSTQPALRGFVLIGDTALAMHIVHRVSEDLEFITVEKRLPRLALETLMRRLSDDGFEVARRDNQAAYEEFLIAGDDLHDHQQDLLIDGVKVSFVAPYPHWAGALNSSAEAFVRVATLPELFRLKAIAASERCLSRDAIDLYFLFKNRGFTAVDFWQAFQGPGIHYPDRAFAAAFENLSSPVKSPTDPGYESLMENAPSREELAKFFMKLRDQHEVEQARLAFLNKDRSR